MNALSNRSQMNSYGDLLQPHEDISIREQRPGANTTYRKRTIPAYVSETITAQLPRFY
jgi:hypothetical protein